MPSTVYAASIANDAMRYNGAGYQYGGSPANGIGKWDCSSFVSWVMGHDLGMSVPMYPNGTYTGKAHGPTAAQYLAWAGASSVARASASPGDLCCWLTHIGIAIAGNQMISAYDTAKGTVVTAIDGAGPTGEALTIRRVTDAVAGGSLLADASSTQGSAGCAKALSGTASLIVLANAYRLYLRPAMAKSHGLRNLYGYRMAQAPCDSSSFEAP